MSCGKLSHAEGSIHPNHYAHSAPTLLTLLTLYFQ